MTVSGVHFVERRHTPRDRVRWTVRRTLVVLYARPVQRLVACRNESSAVPVAGSRFQGSGFTPLATLNSYILVQLSSLFSVKSILLSFP